MKALLRVPPRPAGRRSRPRRAVHRRGVDHRAAGLEQHAQHFRKRRALLDGGRRRRSARCRSRRWAASRRRRGSCAGACGLPSARASLPPPTRWRRQVPAGRSVKVMSCQGDLEIPVRRPGHRRTPIQGHARRLGKSRDCEGFRGIAVLSRFQRMADVAGLLPRPVFTRSSPTLPSAFRPTPSRVLRAKACRSKRVVADHRAAPQSDEDRRSGKPCGRAR